MEFTSSGQNERETKFKPARTQSGPHVKWKSETEIVLELENGKDVQTFEVIPELSLGNQLKVRSLTGGVEYDIDLEPDIFDKRPPAK
jgi:hypothetical protein